MTAMRTLPMTEQLPAQCCPAIVRNPLREKEAEVSAALFKALSDPHRVRIVNMLAMSPEPVCVCDITATFELSQPTVSFHLKKLLSAGLVTREQRGVWAYYALDREAMKRLSGVFSLGGSR